MDKDGQNTRYELREDALKIRDLIADGKRPREIKKILGLAHNAYYRRYHILEDMVKKEFSADHKWALFLRYKTRIEGVSDKARALVERLMEKVETIVGTRWEEKEKRNRVVKVSVPQAVVSALKLIVECEDRVLSQAMDLGVIPRAPARHEIAAEVNQNVNIAIDNKSIDELTAEAESCRAILQRNSFPSAPGRN